MTPRDVLVKARELIATPERWTQGASARDAPSLRVGHPVNARSRAAMCWCLSGAVDAGAPPGFDGTKAAIGAFGLLESELVGLGAGPFPYGNAVVCWNDQPERTHAEVLALLDRAIEAAT